MRQYYRDSYLGTTSSCEFGEEMHSNAVEEASQACEVNFEMSSDASTENTKSSRKNKLVLAIFYRLLLLAWNVFLYLKAKSAAPGTLGE